MYDIFSREGSSTARPYHCEIGFGKVREKKAQKNISQTRPLPPLQIPMITIKNIGLLHIQPSHTWFI